MSRLLSATLALCAVAFVAGCTSSSPVASPSEDTTPTIDPSLIPTAPPEGVTDVDVSLYSNGFGEYIFMVGDGPAWCSIIPADDAAVCEQNEVVAEYQPIPSPEDCRFSFGYQAFLHGTKQEGDKTAYFPCTGGFYTDPTDALKLASGERITIAPFTCFVTGITARCDNQSGQYIVLGPQAWALGN